MYLGMGRVCGSLAQMPRWNSEEPREPGIATLNPRGSDVDREAERRVNPRLPVVPAAGRAEEDRKVDQGQDGTLHKRASLLESVRSRSFELSVSVGGFSGNGLDHVDILKILDSGNSYRGTVTQSSWRDGNCSGPTGLREVLAKESTRVERSASSPRAISSEGRNSG